MSDEATKVGDIPWYRNLKGIHVLLVSFGCLILFFLTDWVVFDFAFIIGLIVGIIQLMKEQKAKKQDRKV